MSMPCLRFTRTTWPYSWRQRSTDQGLSQMSTDVSHLLTSTSSRLPLFLIEEKLKPYPRGDGSLGQQPAISSVCWLSKSSRFPSPNTSPLDFLACRMASRTSLRSHHTTYDKNYNTTQVRKPRVVMVWNTRQTKRLKTKSLIRLVVLSQQQFALFWAEMKNIWSQRRKDRRKSCNLKTTENRRDFQWSCFS